ncbi:nuclear pore complex protein Nup214-like isoform X2 [Myxocyprinus asiaticus]|uniref:nuclear pore complex protein Nup214-like isoform X2 n=1 Tax=Myxocyprinus asiaticus TaxID=70543 RepID=UPI0022215782|nr:nuclear pore complex protein Nup214-like isoform X2 [Myxocyprinus asiaticus]
MGDDPDSIPEREMKDFQFRHMKKIRVFESPHDLPKERSSLLVISNKYGLTFAARDKTLKVFLTKDIVSVARVEGNPNEIVENVSAVTVTVDVWIHHMALSSDELTLSVCGVSDGADLTLDFYDVRTFFNKVRQDKRPFTSFRPAASSGVLVQDLKWSPVEASRLATCLSDGSMMVLDVQDSVNVVAQLPASAGITCVCWSPKGKQVSAGKQDATVVQFTPTLQAKKVIPCPSFYSQDNPVKVLDVLWLSTYNFAVAYAAADGSPETPPELVVVSLPKKDEKRDERYLNFNDLVYGTCTERQHHFFLCHIEDWDLVLAASAAAIEVSIIAKQEDKVNWELWLLEDASRAELPVTENNDDTLPVGVAIDYTSQDEIQLSDEKRCPPAPTLMLLSTDGVLCPFSLLNLNHGVKQLTVSASDLPMEEERPPPAKSTSFAPAVSGAASIFSSFPASSSTAPPPYTLSSAAPPPSTLNFTAPPPSTLNFTAPPPSTAFFTAPPSSTSSSAAPPPSTFSFTAPPPAATSVIPPSSAAAPPPASSSTGFSFSLPPLGSSAPSAFSLNSTAASFSFNAPKPPSDAPGASAFSFSSSSLKEVSAAPISTPQRLATASPIISSSKPLTEPATPPIRMNLTDRFLSVETPASASSVAQPFSLTSTPKPPLSSSSSEPSSQTAALINISKPAAAAVMSRPAQISVPPAAVALPPSSTASEQAVSVKALEKHLQQKKVSDPVMTGILEEIGHFQKELDELKSRCRNADFRVGNTDEMRDLRKDSESLHDFTLEIKDTTESLHGDISMLKTSLLEGFAGEEEARAQNELNRDKDYLQLLYKKPLDPRREEQLKEIRRLYQYVKFAMEDVNDVLDLEWEKHLEKKKKKQRHMIVPEREALFTALANNLDIINQQKQRLDQLTSNLHKLRLYRRTSVWSYPSQTPSTPSEQSLDSELESLKDALLKASLDTAPKAPAKSPSKMTPAKQSQLRNFLSKRQTPPVRSTAPVNLSRSAFLSPQFCEDLDEVSSSSSLSQPLEPDDTLALAEKEEEPGPVPVLSVSRHPTVVRTPSIQPGFSMQSTPFSRIQAGPLPVISPAPKINMDSADSTALATKTVKHGAPPTERTTPTTIPAPQAAGRAALSRHMTSQIPGAALTESTLKTVPQVVTVQDYKGPPIPVSTVISSSVPAPAAQVVQQVLATVEATKGALKVSAPLAGVAQTSAASFVFGGAGKPDVGGASSVSEKNSKAFSFSPSSGFSFMSSSQSQDASNTQAKSSGLPGKFSFASSTGPKMPFGSAVSEEPFSFTPKLAFPAQTTNSSTPPPGVVEPPKLPQAPKAQGNAGETLGCFSGLRVGQSDEVKEAPKPILSFSFGPPGNGSTGFMSGSAQMNPGESASSSEPAGAPAEVPKTTTPQGSAFMFKTQEGTAPSTKPAFSIPQTSSFPSAATSFDSLLRAPLPETTTTVPAKSLLLEATSSIEPVPSSEAEAKEPPAEPSPEPPAVGTPSIVAANEGAIPSQPASTENTVVPSNKPPTPPIHAPEVSPSPPPSVTPPAGPPPVAEPPAVEPVSVPAPEGTTTPTPVLAPQESPANTPFSAPSSDTPGSIFAPPSGATDSLTLGVISLTPVTSTVASSTTSTPTAASTTSTAPTPVFSQPSSAAPSTGFGSTAFVANSTTSGFGKPAFGQTTSAGFGQPAASGSSSSFTFGQPSFSAGSGFGQLAAAVTTSDSSSGGGLFGSSNANSASSFSFAASTTSTAANTGTGLFGQSSAPVFGQPSSGFGQGSVFGSNTTTAPSSEFSFGQPSVFGSSATSVFGQLSSSAGVFGQAQSSGGLFGSATANTSSGSGFFSGLGGKPSEDAANKNPFGVTATGGFGQSINTGSPNLFGNSTAKGFSFSSSSFGDQKPSGSFSTGGGSVAAQGFGSFSTPTKPGGFGSAPVFGSPPTFGGSPAFGGTASFGSAPSFSSPLGTSPGKVFGEGTAAANVGGFGFASPSAPSFGSLANQSSAPSFGSIAQQQPSGFGAPSSGFSGFGSSGGFGGFGNTNANQSSSQTFSSWRS